MEANIAEESQSTNSMTVMRSNVYGSSTFQYLKSNVRRVWKKRWENWREIDCSTLLIGLIKDNCRRFNESANWSLRYEGTFAKCGIKDRRAVKNLALPLHYSSRRYFEIMRSLLHWLKPRIVLVSFRFARLGLARRRLKAALSWRDFLQVGFTSLQEKRSVCNKGHRPRTCKRIRIAECSCHARP